MTYVNSREFRDNQASYFNRADNGEQIIINRRGKQSYMLVPVSTDEFVMTPELQARIEEARADFKTGNVFTISTEEELRKFFDSI